MSFLSFVSFPQKGSPTSPVIVTMLHLQYLQQSIGAFWRHHHHHRHLNGLLIVSVFIVTVTTPSFTLPRAAIYPCLHLVMAIVRQPHAATYSTSLLYLDSNIVTISFFHTITSQTPLYYYQAYLELTSCIGAASIRIEIISHFSL